MELKYKAARNHEAAKDGFNRTFMELKCEFMITGKVNVDRF